jgi:hypothetical protein
MYIRIYTNVHRNTTDHAHHAIMRRSFGRSFFCLAWTAFSSDHPGLLLPTSHPHFALESPVCRRRDRRLSI